jgi:hypothetical protein
MVLCRGLLGLAVGDGTAFEAGPWDRAVATDTVGFALQEATPDRLLLKRPRIRCQKGSALLSHAVHMQVTKGASTEKPIMQSLPVNSRLTAAHKTTPVVSIEA